MTRVPVTVGVPTPRLAAIASHGLALAARPGEPDGPGVPLADGAFEALLAGVIEERLSGLFAAWLRAPWVEATPEQLALADAAAVEAAAVALRLESALLAVVAALEADGIELRVLKGAAVAHTAYPDPLWRSFGDVDLLVRGRDFDRARAVLGARGCIARYREPRAGFTGRFGKGACVVAPNGVEIDLHRAFVAGPFGLVSDPDVLFAGDRTFELGGRRVPMLDHDDLVLHAAAHALLGSSPPRLVPLRDLAELLVATTDTASLLARARALRLTAVLAGAIGVANHRLALAARLPLSDFAAAHRPDRFERRALPAYVGPRRSYPRQVVAGLRALPSARDRLAYARALVLPSAEYLHERDGSYRRRVARAARLGLRGRR